MYYDKVSCMELLIVLYRQFRITMAAIDPSAPAEIDETADADTPARATLKLIRQPPGMDDHDDSEGESDEEDYLNALLGGADSEDEDDEDESSDEEEVNGGPSDPAKSKKGRKDAAVEQLKQALANDESMELDVPNGVNGALPKSNKGKAKATGEEEDSDDDDDEDDDDEDLELEEFVICTLDPGKVRG